MGTDNERQTRLKKMANFFLMYKIAFKLTENSTNSLP